MSDSAFLCVYALGCTGLRAVKTSCRILSSEVPQPCQAVTAPLSHQQEGAEWMCTSIIFLRSIRFLNLEQLGCVSSLWKTLLECLCLVTVQVFFSILIPAIYVCLLAQCSVLAGTHPVSSKEEQKIDFLFIFYFFSQKNMLVWFTKSV